MTIATYPTAVRFQISAFPQTEEEEFEDSGPVARIIITSVARATGEHEASFSSDRLALTRDLTRGRSSEAAYD